MTELILIRHGETDWNRELRFQGQIDVPLNSMGLEQAQRLAARLSGEPIDHLLCSDLQRAMQTALPITLRNTALLGQPLTGLVEFREQNFGVAEGLCVDEIKTQHPLAWSNFVQFRSDFAFSGGESTLDFHDRVMGAVQDLAKAYPEKVLALVTHGGVLDMIYRFAHRIPLTGPRQSLIPNAGLSRIRTDGDSVQILNWADTGHLVDLPPQPVYNQAKLAEGTWR